MENCRSSDLHKNADAGKLGLRSAFRKCRHYYLYLCHPRFGRMHVQIMPYTDLAPMIKKVVAAFGANCCMWESDCPFQVQEGHTNQASVDLVLRRLDFLSDDDKDWLLRKTAASFFFPK